jgi:hypothetical protein
MCAAKSTSGFGRNKVASTSFSQGILIILTRTIRARTFLSARTGLAIVLTARAYRELLSFSRLGIGQFLRLVKTMEE